VSSCEEGTASTAVIGDGTDETVAERLAELAFLRALAHVPEVAPPGEVLTHLGAGGDPRRFALGKKLGAGGFGIVYEAVDRAHGATVALKICARRTSCAGSTPSTAAAPTIFCTSRVDTVPDGTHRAHHCFAHARERR